MYLNLFNILSIVTVFTLQFIIFFFLEYYNFVLLLNFIFCLFILYILTSRKINIFSPFYIFYLFFVLFYLLGPLISLFYFGDSFLSFQYANTFANSISLSAIKLSYYYTFLFNSTFFLYLYFFCKNTNVSFYNNDYFKLSKLLFSLTLIPVLYYLIEDIIVFSNLSYATVYINKDVNFMRAIVFNIFRFSIFILLLFCPRNKYLFYSFIFVVFSFLDALKGSRGAFILPFFMVVFIYNTRFVLFDVKVFKKYLLLLILFVSGVFWQVLRSSSLDSVVMLFSQSLSRGVYVLSLSIDNQVFIESNAPFVLQPLLFVFKYIIYGSSIVGQSIVSAQVRGDLNHTLSFYLNEGAYLSGAGLGSSALAEFSQYGVLYFLFCTYLFLFIYHNLFKLCFTNKFFYFFLPLIYLHFIFSSRDTAFPIILGFTKYLFFIILFIIFVFLFKKRFSYVITK